MQGSLDYRLPYDVELYLSLTVYCTKIILNSPFLLSTAEINCNGHLRDISDILTDNQRTYLVDKWCEGKSKALKCFDIKMMFEVTFFDKDEIDTVTLNGHDINDIVFSCSIEEQLIDAVKEGREKR
jgi:hypothetical protein